ncbi:MAG: TonB-dependent receptor [Deltaproteobacteria bacterium]
MDRANGWRKRIAAGALAALFAATAAGVSRAEEPERLDPIVVTATRIERKVSEQASSVSVVTQDEIALESPPLAGDVLRRLPGVVVQRSGSAGNLENIRIRGGKSTHTLVLIDGFPVNSPTLGEFDIGSLSTAGFERIEVVRGPQSALYGSNAMGGVVQFIPRRGEAGIAARAEGAAGSYGTRRVDLLAQGGWDIGSLSLAGSRLESDGILPNDDTSLRSFVGTGELTLGKTGRFHGIVLSYDQEKGIPTDWKTFNDLGDRDPNHRNDRRGLLLGGRLELDLTPTVTVKVSGGTFEEDFDIHDPTDPGEGFAFDSLTSTRKTTVGAEARYVPSPGTTTILGVEYGDDQGENRYDSTDAFFGPFSSSYSDSILDRAVYVQEEFRPAPGAGVSLGARWNRNSVAGTQFNPRAGAFYTLGSTGIRIRAAAGRGFRAPTIAEKTDPFFGNVDLTRERAVSYEAGADITAAGNRVRISVTGFYQDFQDMIEYDPGTFRMVNADGIARGIETEAAVRIRPEVGVQAAYAYSDTWDKTLAQRILGVPGHRWAVSLSLDPAPTWRARIDWRGESDQLDAPLFSGKNRRPGFAVLDAFLSFHRDFAASWVKGIELSASVRNLFDREYEERIDNPAPGANFLLGAAVRL